MGETLLTIKNLSAWYSEEKRILSGFSFSLAEHEVAGLIGLNGAGKTTFLKVLSGLLPTFRSDGICFYGAPVDFRKQDFKLCRYTVFAEDNSFSYFTFREYLAYVCAAYGKGVPDVSELVHGFHFEEYTDTLLRELSTGNRKKAFLITAFALKPRLLLLDEPVYSLRKYWYAGGIWTVAIVSAILFLGSEPWFGLLLLAGGACVWPVLLYVLLALLAVEIAILLFICGRHPE